jgi:TPP-dependent pyruvate/acetoin dehydrogenase alpha subunit
MPAERIENNDVLQLFHRFRYVAAQVRAGSGPWFFEVMTYRWKEHVGPNFDYQLGYRPELEAEPWLRDDQVTRLANLIAPAERDRIEEEVEMEIRVAFAFAEASSFPEPAALYADVFTEN